MAGWMALNAYLLHICVAACAGVCPTSTPRTVTELSSILHSATDNQKLVGVSSNDFSTLQPITM